MTNTTNRRSSFRCIDCNRVITAANRTIDTSHVNPLCDDCYDVAGLENEHTDGHHTDAHNDRCPMCTGSEVQDRSKASTTRTTKGRIDHTACYAAQAHDKSREGRAGCRKLGGPKA